MPLINQQDVVSVAAAGGGVDQAIAALKQALEAYPPVRIVSVDVQEISNPLGRGSLGTRLTAVVETV